MRYQKDEKLLHTWLMTTVIDTTVNIHTTLVDFHVVSRDYFYSEEKFHSPIQYFNS